MRADILVVKAESRGLRKICECLPNSGSSVGGAALGPRAQWSCTQRPVRGGLGEICRHPHHPHRHFSNWMFCRLGWGGGLCLQNCLPTSSPKLGGVQHLLSTWELRPHKDPTRSF